MNEIYSKVVADLLQIRAEAIDRIGFLRNATRSRQTEKNTLSKCIELCAAAIAASESIGAPSYACATVGFC